MNDVHARGRIVSVNRGSIKPLETPRGTVRSAIDKQPVPGPVAIGKLGLVDDRQAEPRFHGGPTKAVYVYATEDLAWWSAELGMPLPPGFVGENLTTVGIELHDLRPGDELHAGTAVLAVTMPRIPCSKLAARIGDQEFQKRFGRALRTGVYCAVVRDGVVRAGDEIAVVRKSFDGETIRDTVAEMYGVELGAGVPARG